MWGIRRGGATVYSNNYLTAPETSTCAELETSCKSWTSFPNKCLHTNTETVFSAISAASCSPEANPRARLQTTMLMATCVCSQPWGTDLASRCRHWSPGYSCPLSLSRSHTGVTHPTVHSDNHVGCPWTSPCHQGLTRRAMYG